MAVNLHDYGLVIGINEYPDYNPLQGAVADANSFYDWLIDKQTGGGLDAKNCVLITSAKPQSDPPTPYQALIDGEFKRFLKRLSQTDDQQNRIYFYFSGHGLGLDTTNVGLCLAEWSKRFSPNAALESNGYLEYFKQLGKFREVFFFLDCCRVREINATRILPPTLAPEDGKPAEDSPDVKAGILYATDFLNVAKEAALDLDNAAREIRGYFTQALIDGLNGDAASAPGGVTLRSLQSYLERELPARSKRVNDFEQKPKFVLQNLATDDDLTIRFGSAQPRNQSTYDRSRVHSLLIENPNQPKKTARVTVYSAGNEIEFRGYDEPDGLALPEGRYFIVSEFQEETRREEITLTQNLTYTVPLAPQRYTAALIAGAATSHEYYTEYAERASLTPNRWGRSGSVFLCLRHVAAENARPGENLAENLVLLDERQNVLTRFAPNEVERGPQGYLAFLAPAAPGLYFLTYYGEKDGNPRQLPLYVFEGWQTQVFVLYKNGLHFGSTRVFLGQGGFSAHDSDPEMVDTGMLALQNPTQYLPDNVLQNLVNGKFINPMVGIIGAYLMLQRQKFDLFPIEMIIRNLENLLHDTTVPDLQVIKYLATNTLWNNRPVYTPPAPTATWTFDEPPMLLWGLQALLKAAVDHPETVKIAPESLLNTIAPRVYADSAWASWKHETAYPAADAPASKSLKPAYSPEPWVVSELLRAMAATQSASAEVQIVLTEPKRPSTRGTLEGIRGLGKGVKEKTLLVPAPRSLDIGALSRQLGLPVGTLQQTITALSTQSGLADEVVEKLRLTPDTMDAINRQWTSLIAPVRKFTLQDIPAVGFEEEMLLNGIGIQSLDDLVGVGRVKKTLQLTAGQLNLTTQTLKGWISDAKKLL